jgi:two-component system phosphate regulon sensor histidine kinase PhoR
MSASLKVAMATLSEEKAKLATVLANIPSGIIMTDAEGSVVLANEAAGRLYGFSGARAEGRTLIEVVHDHEIEALLRACLKSGLSQSTQVDSAGGRFLRVIAVPLKPDAAGGALLVLQDLTEMRSLQAMRQEFLGNISHELRTPLAAIKAIVETLQNGAIDDRPAALDFLGRVDSEVDGMTQMVNELIELSRVETGKAELNLQPVDIDRLAGDVVARLTPQAERAGVSLSWLPKAGLPAVQADADRIRQVLANIVHNAIKFTPSGGKVRVHSGVEGDMVTVSVTDTGVGISREDLPHIFERFFKADKSRSSGGSGLGLAIAKHIIVAHQGAIRAESESGKGSTFIFSLPLRGPGAA